jgi:hypothetical protein
MLILKGLSVSQCKPSSTNTPLTLSRGNGKQSAQRKCCGGYGVAVMIDEKYAHWAKKEILFWCFPLKNQALYQAIGIIKTEN